MQVYLCSFLVWPWSYLKRIRKSRAACRAWQVSFASGTKGVRLKIPVTRCLREILNLLRAHIGVREMRMSKFKLSSWLTVVATVLVSGMATAQAAPNAANGQTIFTQGKGDAQPCQTCHGDKAQGNDAMGAPRLANIGYGYIVKQLTNFAQDKRTPAGVGAVMPGFAKALSEQDRRDVSAYVNSLNNPPELSNLQELKAGGQAVGEPYKGAEIAQHGTSKVSACSSCHEFNGRGADPVFPKIGQQKYVYLVNQLHNWRANAADVAAGTVARTNDPEVGKVGIMRAVAKNLTDEDILNVAAYLSAASPTKGAGDTAPDNKTLMEKVEGK
jgi:cytochrome c553